MVIRRCNIGYVGDASYTFDQIIDSNYGLYSTIFYKTMFGGDGCCFDLVHTLSIGDHELL
ncbi:hypothetical protein Scep_004767 [Stephania cephalantha]|uniref:Uncharacterized protein n=1 Tax=Stephania cephalantha TaxID=152367 RepID=A0AAP0KUG1_9MAGN